MNSEKPRLLRKAAPSGESFFAPCPRGLAPALAEELAALGALRPQPADAGVAFTGPFDLVYTANLRSRIASRILWRVARFPYANENDIYGAAREVRWRELFAVERTFKVETNAHRSPVKSLDFVTLRVKDAIADHFRDATGSRPSVSARDPDVRVHAFLDARECTLYVDTSGEPLFKRGRREHVGEAPLKKNLAAGILHLAGWKPGMPLLDPMCGAGTFLSEAADMSLARAAGRERDFGFRNLARFEAPRWERLHAAALREQKPLGLLPIYGSDLLGRSVEQARRNLQDAGLEGAVTFKQANLLELSAPAAHGMLVTNPPYGVRLGEKERLAEFYPVLGDALKQRFAGWTAFIFSGDPELAKRIRLHPSRKTVLFNGALECRLYEYRMVAGGNRARAAER
ncbi:MAG TPA: THUMP domain-containing protein [Usitatibacter sp.]|nr:THUMP domain-containing protein [Usitatibacter sp.]